MTEFVKIKILRCEEGGKYWELVGNHGMALDKGDHYHMPHLELDIPKENAELTDEEGQNF